MGVGLDLLLSNLVETRVGLVGLGPVPGHLDARVDRLVLVQLIREVRGLAVARQLAVRVSLDLLGPGVEVLAAASTKVASVIIFESIRSNFFWKCELGGGAC